MNTEMGLRHIGHGSRFLVSTSAQSPHANWWPQGTATCDLLPMKQMEHVVPPPKVDVQPGDIVVTEIDAIEGLVATCPRGGVPIPPPPAIPLGEDGKADAKLSKDGTLRWRWEHRADGTRYIAADYFYQGRWLTGIEQSLVPTGN